MKTFVILGMHRSATSLFAQGAHKAGVHMGTRLLGAHPSNPYGHWEDIDFIHKNDMLLNEAGGSWDNPPPKSSLREVGRRFHKHLREFVNSKKREPLWGWKDPRTTLTVECWLPHLINPHFICCFRDPLEVAHSLKQRDGMPTKKGLELAGIYNARLCEFLTKHYSTHNCVYEANADISDHTVHQTA